MSKEALLEALDISFSRLDTPYLDCMMLHSIGNTSYGGIERIQNPAICEAWDEAKKLGKDQVHTPYTYEEVRYDLPIEDWLFTDDMP